MSVTLTDSGLRIGGAEVPVYSGAVHYWRLERDRWPALLDQVVMLGFQMIETYIPWSIHEISPGEFDWGQLDGRKDVAAFMRLCEERGLWLLVRPGPLINAELTDFGFPEWVLLDPEVQARTAVDALHLDAAWGLHPPRPFPVPSYASERFYHYVAGWYDAICPLIARHLAPGGCVVAVQSDNETCYLFHDQTYATDYSPGSLDLYRRFLAERYGSLSALNQAYGSEHSDFAAVEPPRDCTIATRVDLPRHLDWVEYKEYQITYAVARCARMLRERGLVGIPIFHDVAFQLRSPLDIARMEAHPDIDWVGVNLYRNKEDYARAVAQVRFLAGSTRLPFVPELGCGIWSHHPLTPTPEEQELITLGALMHGLKSFNLYMLVERERWQGSPITRDAALRPGYADFYRRLLDFLFRYRFWRFQRSCAVLVLRSYDLGRYAAATQTLAYAHADLLNLPAELFSADTDLGLQWDVAAELDEQRSDTWFGGLLRLLKQRSLDYDLADTHIAASRLARYPLVLLHTTEFLDLNDQLRLLDYVKGGGTLVLGPGLPATDPTLRLPGPLHHYLQDSAAVLLGRGRLIWADTLQLPAILADLAPVPEYRSEDPQIDLAVLTDGERSLLFGANPTAERRSVTLRFAGQRILQSVWGTTATLRGEGSLAMTLEPYSVTIWEAARD